MVSPRRNPTETPHSRVAHPDSPGSFQGKKKGVSEVTFLAGSVSPRKIANLCGQPYSDIHIFEAGDELGLKSAYNRYGRREARMIIAKLMVGASDPAVIDRLLDAYRRLAPGSEDGKPAKAFVHEDQGRRYRRRAFRARLDARSNTTILPLS